MTLKFTALFGSTPRNVELSSPSGAGGSTVHIYIDRFYHGSIHFHQGEWVAHMIKTDLSGDEVGELVQIVKTHSPTS